MCNDCVKEDFPERDTMCLDTGSYMLNYAGCAQCGGRELEIKNRIITEDVEEFITYHRKQQSLKNLSYTCQKRQEEMSHL